MGTAALEATFEVMQTGYCDSNWAKEHHDLWYDEVKDSEEPVPHQQAQSAPGAPQSTDST
jgi:formate dehydrogenase subunit gamma